MKPLGGLEVVWFGWRLEMRKLPLMVVLSKTQIEFFEFAENGGDVAKNFGNTSIKLLCAQCKRRVFFFINI